MSAGRGKISTIGCPIKLGGSPMKLERPPTLGEHTDALLTELCGAAPEDLERLRKDGVT